MPAHEDRILQKRKGTRRQTLRASASFLRQRERIRGYNDTHIENNVLNNLEPNGFGIMVSESRGIMVMHNPAAPENININILNNEINDGMLGIHMFDNYFEFTDISNNTITFSTSTQSLFKMGISTANSITHPWITNLSRTQEIHNNVITNADLGIQMWNRPSVSIFENSINISSLGILPETSFGINVVQGNASFIYCNSVSGDDNASEVNQIGINAEIGGGFWMVANECSNLGRAIQCQGINSGLVILNEFIDSRIGFALSDNGVVGNIGLPTLPFDNVWNATNPGVFDFTAHSRTYRNTNGKLSHWNLRNPEETTVTYPSLYPFEFNSDQDPTQIGGASVLIPFSGRTSQFTFTPNCNNVASMSENTFDVIYAEKIIRDSILYETNETDSLLYRWWQRRYLYISLIGQDSLIQAYGFLDSFFTEYSATDIVKLDSIKLNILLTNPSSPDSVEILLGKINSVNANNEPEENLKLMAYNYLLIRSEMANQAPYNAIKNIAAQCVFYGGPAVWEARALLAIDSIELLVYSWRDSCTMPSSKTSRFHNPINTEVSNEPDYRLHPTIIDGQTAAYIILQSKEKGSLVFYTIEGRPTGEFKLNEGRNNLDVNRYLKSSGIYLYKVWVDGQLKRTDKIIKVN